MKKQVTLIIAAIMILGSIKAMAMTDSEMDHMIADGKVVAVEAANMRRLLEESEKRVEEIREMGEMIGSSMEDSHGLLKFLGEKETFAEMALNQMKSIDKEIDSLEGDELFKASFRMEQLSIEIRLRHEEAQSGLLLHQ